MSKQPLDVRTFRTLTGPARRAAMRAHLVKHDGLVFGLDPHAIPMSHQFALATMAKAVSWKKSISSPMSLGLAFYVYLSRDVSATVQRSPIPASGAARRGPGIMYGRACA